MANDQTLLVSASDSPLECDLALFVGFRSHMHVGAFVNRLGNLSSVATDVELIASGATPALLSGSVGAAVMHADDQKLEYQQALRTLLSDLTPAAWVRANVHSDRDIPTEQLESRIRGLEVRLSRVEPQNSTSEIAVLARAVCLNSVVLICRFEADRNMWIDGRAVVAACRRVVHNEPDIDAVAVFRPLPEQPAMLFTRQDLREAIGLPSGALVPPAPSLAGLPLVDLLFKHFDGSVLPTSWTPGSRLGGAMAGELASRSRMFAEQSAASFELQAGRAQIPGKRSGWGAATSQVDLVVRFVEKLDHGDPIGAFDLIVGEPEP